ncbi:MAG: SDR family oxidoreductase [Pseudomonadota bacterium]|nr:SDR family oxidoreductase [Pseudomonadota bacterium]
MALFGSSAGKKDKTTILVTGASRGLGFGLVRALAQRGERVLAACRAPEEASALQGLALTSRKDITVHRMDVTDGVSVAAARAVIGDAPVHGIINNAGIIGPQRQSTLDMDFDGFLETLAVNTLGPLRVVQAFLPNLRAAPAAKILTITSRMGSFAASGTDRIAYRTSKAAVNRIMLALARDLEPEGIAVGLVHPGWVRTDMGGDSADLGIEESVAGILKAFDGLSVATAGRFLDYDGAEIAW